jgi:hypothetical protein
VIAGPPMRKRQRGRPNGRGYGSDSICRTFAASTSMSNGLVTTSMP